MNKNEELIYSSAFRLFLQKGYHDVSVKDLEAATNLSRGAVFYYQRDKRALYTRVLESYFLSQQSVERKLSGYEACNTLAGFIDFYLGKVEKSMTYIYEDVGKKNILQPYLLLSLEAHKHIPDFNGRMEVLFEEERNVWRKIIDKAKLAGEISQTFDTEVIVTMFRTAFFGLVFETSFSRDLNISKLQNLFSTIYNLLMN
ncbi:DNA-binding transcriptional regulator EnvR [Porphyromonas crevioricanis]|uniref:DNA-binding transcriptional regulator EnvR n=1 Tax=Porphyromonas crevioricanis TaxID=393921 RepID=A0A2X4PKB3_9PORP|nr:TetR/AcrR family transcriptional regulator [Porphyromonas crevioricanis]GAD07264.1 transcriptional regulator, TetR family [Porphyromonas crevioricanis JCM 13913]SQH72213.1 DNA-binding transcriptional regulator EnvR [Porphyromonas crevioricanis]